MEAPPELAVIPHLDVDPLIQTEAHQVKGLLYSGGRWRLMYTHIHTHNLMLYCYQRYYKGGGGNRTTLNLHSMRQEGDLKHKPVLSFEPMHLYLMAHSVPQIISGETVELNSTNNLQSPVVLYCARGQGDTLWY